MGEAVQEGVNGVPQVLLTDYENVTNSYVRPLPYVPVVPGPTRFDAPYDDPCRTKRFNPALVRKSVTPDQIVASLGGPPDRLFYAFIEYEGVLYADLWAISLTNRVQFILPFGILGWPDRAYEFLMAILDFCSLPLGDGWEANHVVTWTNGAPPFDRECCLVGKHWLRPIPKRIVTTFESDQFVELEF